MKDSFGGVSYGGASLISSFPCITVNYTRVKRNASMLTVLVSLHKGGEYKERVEGDC